mmetsp:Transcript_110311/g.321259  ORF Transcript_110311/g.321259 Transcript_110311/m.321259 type:complete len:115 (+) Transcript_110311:133-477(+)
MGAGASTIELEIEGAVSERRRHHSKAQLLVLPDTILKRCLFYLNRGDLLLVAAVLSKYANEVAKHNMIWRLTIDDQWDKSSTVIAGQRERLLDQAPAYGIAPPTDEQAAQDAFL